MTTDPFLRAAIDQAQLGLREGGLPIGSVLVVDGEIIGRGRNRRVQQGSVIRHAEMDCLERAGRLSPATYRRSVLYSTLSPCDMCSGAALLYGIPRIVVGEHVNFKGPEDYLKQRGILIEVHEDSECIAMMQQCIAEHPELWWEDIGQVL